MANKKCPFCGSEPEIIPALVETWARCPNRDCYIGGCMMYLKEWNKRHICDDHEFCCNTCDHKCGIEVLERSKE